MELCYLRQFSIIYYLLNWYPVILSDKKNISKYMEIQTQAVKTFNIAAVKVPAET